MDEVFLEDCRDTMRRGIAYDYAFFSPPDYDELGLEPVKDDETYLPFLRELCDLLAPRKNLVTIVVSDRKYHRKIIPKHAILLGIMEGLGYELLSQKIWEKSPKVNLYRLNYAFVLTFACGAFHSKNAQSFMQDIWIAPHASCGSYSYNMPKEVVLKCLENYTEAGDVVYDPCMGSGTTALAAVDMGRNYLGSEIDKDTHSLCLRRLGKRGI